jgi:hypothetical protein
MATLDGKHKRLVVRRLAVFDRPSEVRDALKDRYGLEASMAQLAHYDPTNENGKKLAEEWKELFWETREAFLEEQKGIALAHKSKRLRELEKQYYRLQGMLEHLPDQNVLGKADVEAEMREVLEQIAKELGGKYTRKQLLELMGENGGPIETEEKGGGMQFFVPEEQDEEELRPGGDGAPTSTNGQAKDE